MANIKALSAAVTPQYRVVGLSLSDNALRSYARQNEFSFPIYKHVQAANGDPFTVDGTPDTVIVEASGIITHQWLGAYNGKVQKEIEQQLRIRLPGLISPPATKVQTTDGARNGL